MLSPRVLAALLAASLALPAGAARADEDRDLLRPDRTTGGQIGAAIGIIVTPSVGPEAILPCTLIGHGVDRLSTRLANDVSGPLWRSLEQGPVGKHLGTLGGDISREAKKFGGDVAREF